MRLNLGALTALSFSSPRDEAVGVGALSRQRFHGPAFLRPPRVRLNAPSKLAASFEEHPQVSPIIDSTNTPVVEESVKELISPPTLSPANLLENSKKAKELAIQFNEQLQTIKALVAQIEALSPDLLASKLGHVEDAAGNLGKETVSITSDITSIIEDTLKEASAPQSLAKDVDNEVTAAVNAIKGTEKDFLRNLPGAVEKIEKDLITILGTPVEIAANAKKLASLLGDVISDTRTVGALITVLFDHILNRAQPEIDKAVTQIQPVIEKAVTQIQPAAEQIANQVANHPAVVGTAHIINEHSQLIDHALKNISP